MTKRRYIASKVLDRFVKANWPSEPFTVAELEAALTERLNIDDFGSSIRTYLYRAVKAGRLKRIEEGVYQC